MHEHRDRMDADEPLLRPIDSVLSIRAGSLVAVEHGRWREVASQRTVMEGGKEREATEEQDVAADFCRGWNGRRRGVQLSTALCRMMS